MSKIIQFSDHFRPAQSRQAEPEHTGKSLRDCLVPLEFALAETDLDRCLAMVSEHALNSACTLVADENSLRSSHYVNLTEAIRANREILARDNTSEEEFLIRSDLVQALENLGFATPTEHQRASRQA